MNRRPSSAAPARAIYLALGWCAVALAIAGALLPVLPTTVFVIAASYCFSKSSPRFERWLRTNRWLGPPLERFAATGGMTKTSKRAALTAMWIAVLISSTLLLAVHWMATAGTLALGVIGTAVILFRVRTVPESANALTRARAVQN